MTAENRNVLQGILVIVVSCAFLALYSFIFDCIYNTSYALNNINYLPYYFLTYLLFRAIGIIPLVAAYYLLAKKTNKIALKIGAIIFIIIIAGLLGKYVGKNDVNLSVGTDGWKYIPVYIAAALSSCIFYEWILRRNRLRQKLAVH